MPSYNMPFVWKTFFTKSGFSSAIRFIFSVLCRGPLCLKGAKKAFR